MHDELGRLAPDILSDRRKRHVQRQDHVVAQDLVLFVCTGAGIATSGGGRAALERGARRRDRRRRRLVARRDLLELVLDLGWTSVLRDVIEREHEEDVRAW